MVEATNLPKLPAGYSYGEYLLNPDRIAITGPYYDPEKGDIISTFYVDLNLITQYGTLDCAVGVALILGGHLHNP